jgi:phage terminase Nu1 subunit (DNA packaging protein)
MPLITRKQAAEELGVTVQSIYMSIKRGKLTALEDANGNILINSDTMRDELKKKSVAAQRIRRIDDKRNSKTHELIPEYEESRARTEHLKAELLELDRKQKEALLVSAADVKNSWAQIISLARTKVLGIPSKAKQRIPDLDTSAMTCLEDIVRESLEDLASSELETA